MVWITSTLTSDIRPPSCQPTVSYSLSGADPVIDGPVAVWLNLAPGVNEVEVVLEPITSSRCDGDKDEPVEVAVEIIGFGVEAGESPNVEVRSE